MEDIQVAVSWLDKDGERQLHTEFYGPRLNDFEEGQAPTYEPGSSEDYSWLKTILKGFPDAIHGTSWRERCHRATAPIRERFRKGEIIKAEAVKLLREAVRRQRMDWETFSKQLTMERRRLHDPKEVLLYLAGAMRERGRSGQPVVLLPGDLEVLADKIGQLDPTKRATGRKSKDLRKIAIAWAHLYRKARRKGIKDPGLIPDIDNQLEATIDMTTEAEHPGRDIGRSAVEKAKARFRPLIDQIQCDPESDILPAPEEDFG